MSRAAATRAATSALVSFGGGRVRSEAFTARHFDLDIHPVEQRPRNARLVVGGAARALAAGVARLSRHAASARVHRGDQLEARRIGDVVIGARHHGLARLQRLAQRFQHARLEFRQARRGTERRDAPAPSRRAWRASRRRPGPACWPNDAGARKGRRRDSLPPSSSPASEATMLTSSISRGSSGGRIEGSRCASIDLPAPGGPTISR